MAAKKPSEVYWRQLAVYERQVLGRARVVGGHLLGVAGTKISVAWWLREEKDASAAYTKSDVRRVGWPIVGHSLLLNEAKGSQVLFKEMRLDTKRQEVKVGMGLVDRQTGVSLTKGVVSYVAAWARERPDLHHPKQEDYDLLLSEMRRGASGLYEYIPGR